MNDTDPSAAELDADDAFETFINAVAHTMDPHSTYLSPQDSEEYRIDMSLSYEGIGARLQSQDDFVEVVEVMGLAIHIQHGGAWVITKAAGAGLMAHGLNPHGRAEIDLSLGEVMDPVVLVEHRFQPVLQLR